MKTLQVTLWLYTTALSKSWDCVRKNWVVSFAPVAYGIILTLAGIIAAQLGMIGGLVYSLVSSACASSGLYLVKNMVEGGKTDINDFLNGFLVYLVDLITFFFILWLPMWVAANALGGVPNGWLVYLLLRLALFVLLNAVPEMIYQGRASGLDLIGASYRFIVENWIEWLVPNLLLFAAGYVFLDFFASLLFGLPAFVQLFVSALVLGLLLAYFMTFRGFLFSQLHGTTR
ncbi:MAG: hypothetical protein ABIP88_02745, partial [Candidatus Binatia bacterium]